MSKLLAIEADDRNWRDCFHGAAVERLDLYDAREDGKRPSVLPSRQG